jgi:hypothetical protein
LIVPELLRLSVSPPDFSAVQSPFEGTIGEGNPLRSQSLLGEPCRVLVANEKLCHILHVFVDTCVIVRKNAFS